MSTSYYSDREQGPQPCIKEEISNEAWGGIIAAINTRINDGSFGYRYPETCSDGNLPYGCDRYAFSMALKAEIHEIPWPLNLGEVPQTPAILDLIEFCYRAVGKPKQTDNHGYFNHYHLRFEREEGQELFRENINRILQRNGLAYELDQDGHIRRLPSEILGEALKFAQFKTGDGALDSLLNLAREKFLNPKPTVRKEALEKLWDAWERLKTIEDPDKRVGIKKLLDKCASEPNFRETLKKEAKELTDIGNTFHIRHSETNQIPLKKNEHVDYLFHRLFALIFMALKMTGRITT